VNEGEAGKMELVHGTNLTGKKNQGITWGKRNARMCRKKAIGRKKCTDWAKEEGAITGEKSQRDSPDVAAKGTAVKKKNRLPERERKGANGKECGNLHDRVRKGTQKKTRSASCDSLGENGEYLEKEKGHPRVTQTGLSCNEGIQDTEKGEGRQYEGRKTGCFTFTKENKRF